METRGGELITSKSLPSHSFLHLGAIKFTPLHPHNKASFLVKVNLLHGIQKSLNKLVNCCYSIGSKCGIGKIRELIKGDCSSPPLLLGLK